MNRLKTFLIMAIAIFSYSAADAETSKKKSKTKKETAATHYQCPMKCETDKTYASAGKCPVCKMNLTKMDAKKTADNHEGHNHK